MAITVSAKDNYFERTGKNIVFSLRLDESVYELVKQAAESQKRSINSQLVLFIENGLVELSEKETEQPEN